MSIASIVATALLIVMAGCEETQKPETIFWRDVASVHDTLGNQWNKCTLHEIWWSDCEKDVRCWWGKGSEVNHCNLNYHGCGPCLPIPKELQ